MKLKNIEPIIYDIPKRIKTTSDKFLLTMSTGFLIAGVVGLNTVDLTVHYGSEPVKLTYSQYLELEEIVFHRVEIIGKL